MNRFMEGKINSWARRLLLTNPSFEEFHMLVQICEILPERHIFFIWEHSKQYEKKLLREKHTCPVCGSDKQKNKG